MKLNDSLTWHPCIKYINSMKAATRKKPTSTNSTSKKRGGKEKKEALLNLNKTTDDSEDELDEEGMEEAELEMLETLERSLKRCQKCGPQTRCKIDKMGSHHALSFQQLRAWTLALVSWCLVLMFRCLIFIHRSQSSMLLLLLHPRAGAIISQLSTPLSLPHQTTPRLPPFLAHLRVHISHHHTQAIKAIHRLTHIIKSHHLSLILIQCIR